MEKIKDKKGTTIGQIIGSKSYLYTYNNELDIFTAVALFKEM